MHQRHLGAALLAAAAATLGFGGIAGAAPATHSGAIAFHSSSQNNGKTLDLVTGAITDHGTDRSVGENFQKIVLSKGTFEVASAKLNRSFRFKADMAACSGEGTLQAANLPISHGTGAYAGITGSISVKATFYVIGIVKDGKCENLERHDAASLSQFSGTGHVSY